MKLNCPGATGQSQPAANNNLTDLDLALRPDYQRAPQRNGSETQNGWEKLCPWEAHPSYLIPAPPASSPNSRKFKITPRPGGAFCSQRFFLSCALEQSMDAHDLDQISFSKPVTETIWAVCTTHALLPSHTQGWSSRPRENTRPPRPRHTEGEESIGETQS